MTILSKPWRIDRRGERIYIDAPGEVCIDLCSGAPEDRARVMALLEQVQAMAETLRAVEEWDALGLEFPDAPRRSPMAGVRAVLRAAGVLDESGPHGRVGP